MEAATRRDAEFEIARLDASKTDWSVYAHHPNIYVRGLALIRLRDGDVPATLEQLGRVAQLLGDASPIYSAECAETLLTCAQGQGIDVARGNCRRRAETVSQLADEILAAAEPQWVVAVMVADLAKPGLAHHGLRIDTDRPVSRLRAAAEKSPETLTGAIADALPKANHLARVRLLNALTLGPLGSGNPQLMTLVVPSLKSDDVLERLASATAILRMTDQPGLVAVSTEDEPRRSAVAVLLALYEAGKTSLVREDLGPAAAPLLDAVMARMRRIMAESKSTSDATNEIDLIAQMGPRAKRASSLLIELGSRLTNDDESQADFERARVMKALAAIEAPVAERKQFALDHATSREGFVAATGALVAARVTLSPDEIARLKRGSVHCKRPNHPRAFDGSWNDCHQANEDLATLERIAQ